MRLRRFWLGAFRNLRDVEISFDPTPSLYGDASIRFFVGLNGTGKSNALEALGLIFSHLAIYASPGISFDLEYVRDARIIRIITPGTFPFTALAEQLDLSITDLANYRIPQIDAVVLVRPSDVPTWQLDHIRDQWASSGDELLPNRVIGYSSGPTSGLDYALARSVDRLVRQRIGAFDADTPPAGYSNAEWKTYQEAQQAMRDQEREAYLDNPRTHFFGRDTALYAAVALLAHDGSADLSDEGRKTMLVERIGLDPTQPLVAFSLRVSGEWETRLTGTRRDTFRRLLIRATRRTKIDPPPGVPSTDDPPPPDFRAVYELDETFRTSTIREIAPTPFIFFEQLLAWRRQGALLGLNLILRKAQVADLLLESSLSDGEFLYLDRYAVLALLRDAPNSLILLDEPETHFNDRWKSHLVRDIVDLLGANTDSTRRYDVVIATHSVLTLTDADPHQVYRFRRDSLTNADGHLEMRTIVERLPISTFAADQNRVSRVISEGDASIGDLAEQEVEQALSGTSIKKVEELLDLTGPGFAQFQLRDKLLDLRDAADANEVKSAPPK